MILETLNKICCPKCLNSLKEISDRPYCIFKTFSCKNCDIDISIYAMSYTIDYLYKTVYIDLYKNTVIIKNKIYNVIYKDNFDNDLTFKKLESIMESLIFQ